jgi:hypothetical protein
MDPDAIRDIVVVSFGCYNRTDVVAEADEGDGSFDEVLMVLAKGGIDTINVARPFLESVLVRERAAAAEIVGRVGEAGREPVRSQAYELLFRRLLDEWHPGVAEAVSGGIGLIWSSRNDTATALSLMEHPNRNVRLAVAKHLALETTDRPEHTEHRAALEHLRRDTDEEVRSWAEFGVDTLTL